MFILLEFRGMDMTISIPLMSSTVTSEGCNITEALTSPDFANSATTLAENAIHISYY